MVDRLYKTAPWANTFSMEFPCDLPSTANLEIRRVRNGDITGAADVLAVEEPLEIRLDYVDRPPLAGVGGSIAPPTETHLKFSDGTSGSRVRKSISITMRTPGADFELAVGFLFTEGIIAGASDIEAVTFCGPSRNVVRVDLNSSVRVDMKRLERHFYTSSSCGVCGKASIAALRIQSRHREPVTDLHFKSSVIHRLPAVLRQSQGLFDATGGLHASALFDLEGRLLLVREDVGRHNALDKVIGYSVKNGWLPLADKLLLVSGRASFELVQKAAMAGVAMFAAVGAPSSLAVELAKESGMTLLGFVRDDRFNIYSGDERVTL